MKNKGISQETLKLIACVTMLIDHIGAMFVPGYALRCIGRLSFPIYCFLLAEGAHYTRNPQKYALRLTVGMLLSELPYDLAFYGGWTWGHQNVMVTLLLGFLALQILEKSRNFLWKLLGVAAMAVLAELSQADYGAAGVVLIALFGLSREMPGKHLIQLVGMLLIFRQMSSPELYRGFTIQMLGALAIVPIALYSGRKATTGKAAQWGFYLFYPVHLAVLHMIDIARILYV